MPFTEMSQIRHSYPVDISVKRIIMLEESALKEVIQWSN